MNGGHQTVGNAEVIVQHLGNGSKAVGGAAGVGNELHIAGIGVVIDAHHEHGGIVLGGGGHDHVLGAGGNMTGRLLLGQEQTGGFDDVFGAYLGPRQVGGIALGGYGNGLAVDDDIVALGVNVTVESAVHGVVFHHIGQIVGGAKIIDAHDLDLRVSHGTAQNHAANTAKTIDANFNAHNQNFLPDGIYQTYGTFRIICNSRRKCKPLFKNFPTSFDKI